MKGMRTELLLVWGLLMLASGGTDNTKHQLNNVAAVLHVNIYTGESLYTDSAQGLDRFS